ncbi:MAG: hypothetical protein ACI8TQ_002247 [Planctomycetota bacterium]
MKNLANFILFQVGWFACVMAAGEGHLWLGSIAVLVIVALHLLLITRPSERRWELGYILCVGVIGMLADTGLNLLGATNYPTVETEWSLAFAPPFITALWILFATLPNHSLGWLRGRTLLAVIFGAIGGPLAYLGGTRFGAVAVAEEPLLTYGALALEYAIVTPLLLCLSRRRE